MRATARRQCFVYPWPPDGRSRQSAQYRFLKAAPTVRAAPHTTHGTSLHRLGLMHRRNLILAVTQLGQHLVGVLAKQR